MMKKILSFILVLCSFSGMAYSNLSWSSPIIISTGTSNASAPAVVIDSNGNVTATWVENNIIYASLLPIGGSWSTPVTLSNSSNTASSPMLGVDLSGNVTALWIENALIESAILPFGGSWSAESSPISASGASDSTLAVDAAGNAVAIWARNGHIESSTKLAGGSWSSVSVLSTATASTNPHIAISSFGTAIAVWQSVVSGADVIVSDILTISSNTWASPLKVFPLTASFHHNYPKVAIDADGNAIVIWFRYNLVNGDVYQNVQVITSSLPQGAPAWQLQPTQLSNFGVANPANLIIKLKSTLSGNAIAVWTNSYDGLTYAIEYSRQLFGGSWSASSFTYTPNLYSFGFDVGIGAGKTLLTSMGWDGVSNINIQAQEMDIINPFTGQGWTQADLISSGANNGYPACAMSLTENTFNAVTLWIYNDGTNNVINAATGSEVAFAPPSNVSAMQSVTNFGVYQDYCNTITWTASTGNVYAYIIFRNGIYITFLDSSTLIFVDHNQVDGGRVTYGVAAILSEGRQSDIVTYTLNP
jgi:hypothetical protein